MTKEYIEREVLLKYLRDKQVALENIDCINIAKDIGRIIKHIEQDKIPAADVVEVKHGYWDEGKCSVCGNDALSSSWDEPIYDYDWDENLTYSYTETHTEYQLTDYCPFCGAKMDGEREE